MSGETDREKDAAILWTGTLTVLAANAGLGAVALSAAAATNAATWQAVGVQAVLAACTQLFSLHRLRHLGAGRSASSDGLFWALVVPVLLQAFGAGVALLAGTQRLGTPAPAHASELIESLLALAVLATAAALMLVALWLLLKSPLLLSNPGQSVAEEPQRAARLALTVQTAAGLVGAVVATIAFSLLLDGSPDADAWGAVLVGLVMAAVAARLSLEIRAALRADPETAAVRILPPVDQALPVALETKSVPLAQRDLGAPAAEAQSPAAAQPPVKTGHKPPVVARQSGKRKRR